MRSVFVPDRKHKITQRRERSLTLVIACLTATGSGGLSQFHDLRSSIKWGHLTRPGLMPRGGEAADALIRPFPCETGLTASGGACARALVGPSLAGCIGSCESPCLSPAHEAGPASFSSQDSAVLGPA
jgi:hypothetical protein